MLELGARSAPSPPLLRTCAAQRVAGHTHQAQMRNGSKASSSAATHPGRLRRLVRRSGCLVNNRLDSAMDCQDEDSIHDRVQPQRTRPRHVDDDVDGYQSNLYGSKSKGRPWSKEVGNVLTLSCFQKYGVGIPRISLANVLRR